MFEKIKFNNIWVLLLSLLPLILYYYYFKRTQFERYTSKYEIYRIFYELIIYVRTLLISIFNTNNAVRIFTFFAARNIFSLSVAASFVFLSHLFRGHVHCRQVKGHFPEIRKILATCRVKGETTYKKKIGKCLALFVLYFSDFESELRRRSFFKNGDIFQ